MKNILIAGGSGLVGTRLRKILREKGYKIGILSRKSGKTGDDFQTFLWNPASGEGDLSALEWADAVINLAGAGIADGRWTAARKRELIESRVAPANWIKTGLQKVNNPPKIYLAASAIGFYGDREDEILFENSAAGAGFLSECCKLWENATKEIEKSGVLRTVIMRIGTVFTTHGGALPEFIFPLKFGVSPYFSEGKMWVSWIHIDDLCGQILFFLENEKTTGIFNCVSPNPLIFKELAKKIAVFNNKKQAILMPVPAFFLKLFFGEMADVVLNSDRVSANKIINAGYKFQFSEIDAALSDLINSKK